MNYIISKRCYNKIQKFYQNVAKKYRHTYSLELMHKNIDTAINAMYEIENGLQRRQANIPIIMNEKELKKKFNGAS